MSNFLSSGPVIVVELQAENAIQHWKDLAGPDHPDEARKVAPSSLRARFGTDAVRNAVHAASDVVSYERDVDFLFPPNGPARCNSACYNHSTCAVIKPHAVIDGVAGDIMRKITDHCGLGITAVLQLTMDEANAEEFLQVYKGVVQEYPLMVAELSCGPCIALEVCGGDDAQATMRQLAGPADPEVARKLRPNSIRALYGRTKAKNAIHCTDLPEDATLEVEYFFKILDQ